MSDYERPAWHALANCRGMVRVFFPERGGDGQRARVICASCPVRQECAEAGRYEQFGIWGGRGYRDPRLTVLTLPPRLSAIDHGTDAGYHSHRRQSSLPCQPCKDAHAAVKRWATA